MFKDIVVNLSAGMSGKIVGDYAISIASRLEAHITGIAIAFVPDIQRAGMAFLSVEKIEALQRDNEAATETIVEWFVVEQITEPGLEDIDLGFGHRHVLRRQCRVLSIADENKDMAMPTQMTQSSH